MRYGGSLLLWQAVRLVGLFDILLQLKVPLLLQVRQLLPLLRLGPPLLLLLRLSPLLQLLHCHLQLPLHLLLLPLCTLLLHPAEGGLLLLRRRWRRLAGGELLLPLCPIPLLLLHREGLRLWYVGWQLLHSFPQGPANTSPRGGPCVAT